MKFQFEGTVLLRQSENLKKKLKKAFKSVQIKV